MFWAPSLRRLFLRLFLCLNAHAASWSCNQQGEEGDPSRLTARARRMPSGCRAPSLRSQGKFGPKGSLPALSLQTRGVHSATFPRGPLPLTPAPSVFWSRTGSVSSSGDWLLEGFESDDWLSVARPPAPLPDTVRGGGAGRTRELTDGR